MQAPCFEDEVSIDAASTRRLLFDVNNNTQHHPLQRLASYQHSRLHDELHQTGHGISSHLAIVQLLTCFA